MEFQVPPPEVAPLGLRALKVVAMADGRFAERERSLLEAGRAMFSKDTDIDALEPIAPEEFAARVLDPALRRQLLRAMLVMSLADGEASAKEAAVVESFREALGVELNEIETFKKLSEGHFLSARLDVARRFWARQQVVDRTKAEGVGWLARSIATLAKLSEDKPLAQKYLALEHAPAGSLGRGYFDFVRRNGFSFPGQKGSPPEPIVIHDLTHVISGYGTTPSGEICVTAFHAGYRKQDPFTWILFSMMQFNMGIRMTPVAGASKLQFDPPKVLEALRRGASMNTDLSDGSWGYWDDMRAPLEEVRAKYAVPPRAGSGVR